MARSGSARDPDLDGPPPEDHELMDTRAAAPRLAALALSSAAATLSACGPSAGPGDAGSEGSGAAPSATPALEAREGDALVDVTLAAGIDFVHVLVDGRMSNVVESLGSGAAVIDCDGDGWLDLYFVQSGWAAGVVEGEHPASVPGDRLYRNRGDGTFEDVTRRAGLGSRGFGLAAVAADYDGDGDQDLYVLELGPNKLYRNRGDGTFEEVGARAGVADPRLSVGAAFLDYDGDSDLDLYVTNYLELDPDYDYHYGPDVFPPPLAFEAQPDALFQNRGDGTFEDVSAASGISSVAGRGMSVVAADFDGDRRTDVFVSNDGTANFLWRNKGDGTFEEAAFAFGLAFGENGEATAAMTADWGDCDGDGAFDLVVTDTAFGSLYHGLRPGLFGDRIVRSGIAALSGQYVSWGGGFLDFDNDSDLDLLIVNGDLHHHVGWEDLLLANDGAGRFSDAAAASAYFGQKLMGRGGLAADYDNDGDVDVLILNLMDRPVLLRNEARDGNAWLRVELAGASANRAGLGAIVTVRLTDRALRKEMRCPSWYLGSGDPRLHFGLGRAERIERVEVLWPSGELQVLEDVAPSRELLVREPRS